MSYSAPPPHTPAHFPPALAAAAAALPSATAAPAQTAAAPQLVDSSIILEDFMPTVENVPSEIQFLFSELYAKDLEFFALREKIQANDASLRKLIKNGPIGTFGLAGDSQPGVVVAAPTPVGSASGTSGDKDKPDPSATASSTAVATAAATTTSTTSPSKSSSVHPPKQESASPSSKSNALKNTASSSPNKTAASAPATETSDAVANTTTSTLAAETVAADTNTSLETAPVADLGATSQPASTTTTIKTDADAVSKDTTKDVATATNTLPSSSLTTQQQQQDTSETNNINNQNQDTENPEDNLPGDVKLLHNLQTSNHAQLSASPASQDQYDIYTATQHDFTKCKQIADEKVLLAEHMKEILDRHILRLACEMEKVDDPDTIAVNGLANASSFIASPAMHPSPVPHLVPATAAAVARLGASSLRSNSLPSSISGMGMHITPASRQYHHHNHHSLSQSQHHHSDHASGLGTTSTFVSSSSTINNNTLQEPAVVISLLNQSGMTAPPTPLQRAHGGGGQSGTELNTPMALGEHVGHHVVQRRSPFPDSVSSSHGNAGSVFGGGVFVGVPVSGMNAGTSMMSSATGVGDGNPASISIAAGSTLSSTSSLSSISLSGVGSGASAAGTGWSATTTGAGGGVHKRKMSTNRSLMHQRRSHKRKMDSPASRHGINANLSDDGFGVYGDDMGIVSSTSSGIHGMGLSGMGIGSTTTSGSMTTNSSSTGAGGNGNGNGNGGPDSTETDENIYCICQQMSWGQMIACDNAECPREWFHLDCVGLKEPPTGVWYCHECLQSQKIRKRSGRA